MQEVVMRKKLSWWWVIGLGLFFLFIFAGNIVNLLTNYLWFKELALTPVFLTTLYTKIGLGAAVGFAAWAILSLNILIAFRLSARTRFEGIADMADMQLVYLISKIPMLKAFFLLMACIISVFIGNWASSYWEVYLKAVHAVAFGANDPLFGRNIGFYVFQLPFYKFIYYSAVTMLVFSFAGSTLIYLVRQNIVFDGRRLHISKQTRMHLLVLVGFFVFSLFFHFQFKIYELVVAQGTLVNGAGYAQIKVGLPLYSVMRFVSLVAALLTWAVIFQKSLRLFILGILLLVAGSLIGFLSVQLMQNFVVAPDELNKEAPYISWSIANTRAAFGLNNVEIRQFVPTADLKATSLENNSQTINNIRLWDKAPLLTTYSQLQEIRTYYSFLDVDNDRYTINGQYRQVMFSPRELVPSSLPSRIWINEHLTYTHGYGLCLGPVNSVTAEGLPDFFVKNIPPSSTIPLDVTRPQIYFGEADAGYAIVKTGAKEFDYPSGNDNVYTVYDGAGGIKLGGLWRKALFAFRFQELKILLREDITSESRILINRQIISRIRAAVPFLHYDSDPYMVITREGHLVWMIDGYTLSDAYPYSASVGDMGNYIRNSVKAVIDAYDGTVDLNH
jgi:uncharacterized protein